MKLNPIREFIIGSRLRNRFALFAVLLAVAPVLTLGGVSLFLIDLSHRQDVSQLELQLIDQKIEEIEKFFADTLGILEIRVGFEQKSEIERSQQEFVLEGLLAENRAFEEVSLVNLFGMETAKKMRFKEGAELLDVSRLEFFKKGASGSNFIGGVYYTLSGPMITLAAPVRNRNNDIIQVVSAEVNLSQITRVIEKARLGTVGYAVLVDRDGSVVAHGSNANVVSGTDLVRLSRVSAVLGGATLDALGEQDRYRSFFGGIDAIGAAKKVPGVGWAILAEWPINDADALIRDIRNEVTVLALFSILAVLLFAPFFAGRLIKPIRALEAGAREIARGNFEKLVVIKTGDELEDLGSTFNKMSKGLKRLKELQEEFVFIAAHDLRAPVTVIRGYISMLFGEEAEKLSPKAMDYLTQVNHGAERLAQLAQDLLVVARSEAGKISIKVLPISIADVIKAALVEVEPQARAKQIVLEYITAQNDDKVLADIERVKEVMANLLTNAVKYTQEGGSVKIFHETKDSSFITHVGDNGIGIPKAAQTEIFQKFYRVPSHRAHGVEGTGLGLFIVKQLVEKMGGKIWFKSEEGKGSTFSFSLRIYGSRTK